MPQAKVTIGLYTRQGIPCIYMDTDNKETTARLARYISEQTGNICFVGQAEQGAVLVSAVPRMTARDLNSYARTAYDEFKERPDVLSAGFRECLDLVKFTHLGCEEVCPVKPEGCLQHTLLKTPAGKNVDILAPTLPWQRWNKYLKHGATDYRCTSVEALAKSLPDTTYVSPGKTTVAAFSEKWRSFYDISFVDRGEIDLEHRLRAKKSAASRKFGQTNCASCVVNAECQQKWIRRICRGKITPANLHEHVDDIIAHDWNWKGLPAWNNGELQLALKLSGTNFVYRRAKHRGAGVVAVGTQFRLAQVFKDRESGKLLALVTRRWGPKYSIALPLDNLLYYHGALDKVARGPALKTTIEQRRTFLYLGHLLRTNTYYGKPADAFAPLPQDSTSMQFRRGVVRVWRRTAPQAYGTRFAHLHSLEDPYMGLSIIRDMKRYGGAKW